MIYLVVYIMWQKKFKISLSIRILSAFCAQLTYILYNFHSYLLAILYLLLKYYCFLFVNKNGICQERNIQINITYLQILSIKVLATYHLIAQSRFSSVYVLIFIIKSHNKLFSARKVPV